MEPRSTRPSSQLPLELRILPGTAASRTKPATHIRKSGTSDATLTPEPRSAKIQLPSASEAPRTTGREYGSIENPANDGLRTRALRTETQHLRTHTALA